MKELIYTWLSAVVRNGAVRNGEVRNGRDHSDTHSHYLLGVEIYRRYGSNSYLKRLFAAGEDHYNVTKLEEELRALLDSQESYGSIEIDPIKSDPPVSPSVGGGHPHEDRPLGTKKPLPSELPEAPAEIKEAIARRKILYARTRSHHDQLYEAHKAPVVLARERAASMALEILQSWDEIAAIWKLTNFYDQHGRLPKEHLTSNTQHLTSDTPTDVLQKKWNTNYKYIRKFQANTSKAEQLTARHAECQQIETILRTRDAFIYENLQLPCLNS